MNYFSCSCYKKYSEKSNLRKKGLFSSLLKALVCHGGMGKRHSKEAADDGSQPVLNTALPFYSVQDFSPGNGNDAVENRDQFPNLANHSR